MKFSRALSTIHTRFQMVGTFVEDQVNAGGSAMLVRKYPLEGGSVLEHVVTHVGRDHLITIRAEIKSLMIASVHLEPGSNLTDLRGRTRAIHEDWPAIRLKEASSDIQIGRLHLCAVCKTILTETRRERTLSSALVFTS